MKMDHIRSFRREESSLLEGELTEKERMIRDTAQARGLGDGIFTILPEPSEKV